MARTGAPERESDAERLRSASDAELLELADALCELDRDLRVVRLYAVALTGYALPEDRAAALAAGFDEHLAKPPELDVLRGLLADVARRRAPPPAGSPGGGS